MYSKLGCFVILLFALADAVHAKGFTTIHVDAGFSVPMQLPEPAATIVIGNQGVIATNTLKPDLLMINAQTAGATSLTVFGRSGKVYEYRVQVGNDVTQLRSIIHAFEKNVVVEDLNGIIVLKGVVPTPTALVRVLTLADRYVSGSAESPEFSVISDKGGVLTGNTNEGQTGEGEDLFGVSPDLRATIPTPQLTGGRGVSGGSAGAGGTRGGGGNISAALKQPLMPIKGNIAQNISRGEIVMVGGGKVMSMIQVAKQPKVEIQMQIVAVDRNKTDDFGIDWRLDATSGNKNITIGSLAGGVSSSAVSSGGTAPGSSDIFATITNPGKYTLSTFLKFLQQKGAAKTLSSPLVTAISGESASFLVGGNIPIPVQTQTVNQVTATTATNVRFIQFGLKLLVRPTVLENGKISITLDQSISEPDYSQAITLLGAQIPGFNQRAVSTITESASGESWAVAGLLSEENSKNLDQVPWLSRVPVIGFLFKRTSEARSRNELMILVNARVIDGDNNTTTNFSGKGDLAPTDDGVVRDSDLPQPELPSTDGLDMPIAVPGNSSRYKSGQHKQSDYLDLPEVIVPPEVRHPKKTGGNKILEGALTIYLEKPDATDFPVVTHTHPAIKSAEIVASSDVLPPEPNLKKQEGRLVYYKEHDASTSIAASAKTSTTSQNDLDLTITEGLQVSTASESVSKHKLQSLPTKFARAFTTQNGFLNSAMNSLGHANTNKDSALNMEQALDILTEDTPQTIPSILQSKTNISHSVDAVEQAASTEISLEQVTYNLSDLTN